MNSGNKSFFKFLILGGCAAGIISLFVPFIEYYSMSQSLWDASKGSYEAHVLLGFAALGILVALAGRKVEMAYLPAGAFLYSSIIYIISAMENEIFDYYQIGFYLLVASGVVTAIGTFLYKRIEEVEDTPYVGPTNIGSRNMYSNMQQPINPNINNLISNPAEANKPIDFNVPNSLQQTNVMPEIKPIDYVEPQQMNINPQPMQQPVQPQYTQPMQQPVNPVNQLFENNNQN